MGQEWQLCAARLAWLACLTFFILLKEGVRARDLLFFFFFLFSFFFFCSTTSSSFLAQSRVSIFQLRSKIQFGDGGLNVFFGGKFDYRFLDRLAAGTKLFIINSQSPEKLG